MAWLGTVNDSDKIRLSQKTVVEIVTFQSGTGGTIITSAKRFGTVTTYQWRGLTEDAATTYWGSHANDSGVEDLTFERMDDSGQHCVTRVEIIEGTFGTFGYGTISS